MIPSSERNRDEETSSSEAVHIEVPEILSEEDKPRGALNTENPLPTHYVGLLERLTKQREHLHALEMQDKAYRLLLGIIIGWIAICVVDFVWMKNTLGDNALIRELIDLFKYLVPTIVGFVFASKSNKN